MKPLPVLLAVSLLANAALVVVVIRRPSGGASRPAPATNAKPSASRAASNDQADALRAALASGDADALEAAGLSRELAREIAVGRIFSRLAERVRTAQPKREADARWWRHRTAPGERAQQLALRRELAEALVAAFGSDLGLTGGDGSQFAFLPPEKRDALRRIVEDYDEMMAKFSAGGIQLASDKEKLRLLKAERDRDIAALLSPEEQLAYEMRTSSTGQSLRIRYGDAIESEADFQKLYTLQKSFDEQFGPETLRGGRITPEVLRQRAEAQQQLQEEFRAALGDEKYAALRRASDGDLRNVESLVSRLNLPPATTDQVVTARESFATESQRINADASLTPQQRRAQIQELAGRAKASVAQTLGSEAGEAYAQSAPWIGMLQSGMAYATTPQTNSPGSLLNAGVGPGVYPVMPAGATVGGVTHQVINRTGGDPARISDGVMTFSAAPVDVGVGAPPAGAARQMIIVAPPSAPADPTAPLPAK